MACKAKRIEQTELFISVWEEEPSLWDVTSSLYKDRDEKIRSLKNLAEKCYMSGMKT